MDAFAITAPGLEQLAADELAALKVPSSIEDGGVSFSADSAALYRANLWLRTASRVIVRVADFHANSFPELERRAKRIDWHRFLPAGSSVKLRVSCRKSRLYHSDAVAERIARVMQSGERGIASYSSGPDSASDDADGAFSGNEQTFIVRIVHDRCTVSVDSSGELLHRRGYRQELTRAPLRETLAAAMLLGSGRQCDSPLMDPMCGSGTIPIEAALLALNIAPGLNRRFAFMNWESFDQKEWSDIHSRAESVQKTSHATTILGSDRDEGAIAIAGRNAERAGVVSAIEFRRQSLSDSFDELRKRAMAGGWVMTNPPYGTRVGRRDNLRDLYASLERGIRDCEGWSLGILAADRSIGTRIRVGLRPVFQTRNGGIPVTFFAGGQA